MNNPCRHLAALPLLTGWRRRLCAFFLGVCGTLALPPFSLPFMLIPAFGGLLLMLEDASPRRALWDGWWWGWGYFMSGLYWICIALLTDAAAFGWLIPFTLLGLTGVIALYPACACWLFARFSGKGFLRIAMLCNAFAVTEWLRGHLFSGFPWNMPGYAFTFSDYAMQAGSVMGAYGLNWLAVLLGAVWAAPFLPGMTRRKTVWGILAVWGGLALVMMGGYLRIMGYENRPPEEKIIPGVHLRLVQADIAQHHKWDPKLQMEGLREHIRLTRAAGLDKITHVIWPETAVPYVLGPDAPLLHLLASALPEKTLLITGSLRAEGDKEHWKIWNSLVALDSEGKIIGSYDKSKLVPFGEFLPFRSLLPASWLTPVGDTDFSGGPGPSTVSWPGLPPLSPLICYEAVFPELAVNKHNLPDFLLNVTNDAWFGLSAGPYQHAAMARMRAVEQGLPLVRVANTGITFVTDAYGRVAAFLPLGSKGILDTNLPVPALSTIYTRTNGLFVLVLILGIMMVSIRQRRH